MAQAPSPRNAPPPEVVKTPVDAGSQALAEALRSSFGIVKFVMIVLVLVFFGSGFFVVGLSEQAIILRLGKTVGQGEKALLGPGLHWSFPYPIDEYRKVSVSSRQTVTSTIGWMALTPEERSGAEPGPLPLNSTMNPLADGYVLTADNNIVHAKATLNYRITDPVAYILNFINSSNTVVAALDNALLGTAANYRVDDILTRDVAGFQEAVGKRVTQLVEQQKLGIQVEDCLVRSRPPRQLQVDFNRVNQAEQERGTAISQARTLATNVLNEAAATARSLTNSAEADSARLVKTVEADARRFAQLLPRYQENPALLTQQLLEATLASALTNASYTILFPDTVGERRLLLNTERPKEPSKP
jgi:modulator of FtsH protease HflK